MGADNVIVPMVEVCQRTCWDFLASGIHSMVAVLSRLPAGSGSLARVGFWGQAQLSRWCRTHWVEDPRSESVPHLSALSSLQAPAPTSFPSASCHWL